MEWAQLKHDFLNNGIRIEVLNKLIAERLESNQPLDSQELSDLEQTLSQQQEFIKLLKTAQS